MNHERKVLKPEFSRIALGEKTFIRLDDAADIQRGDKLKLLEWDDSKINAVDKGETGPTGKALVFTVGFIEHASKNQAILSLLPTPGLK